MFVGVSCLGGKFVWSIVLVCWLCSVSWLHFVVSRTVYALLFSVREKRWQCLFCKVFLVFCFGFWLWSGLGFGPHLSKPSPLWCFLLLFFFFLCELCFGFVWVFPSRRQQKTLFSLFLSTFVLLFFWIDETKTINKKQYLINIASLLSELGFHFWPPLFVLIFLPFQNPFCFFSNRSEDRQRGWA